jgi:hypothetical protein
MGVVKPRAKMGVMVCGGVSDATNQYSVKSNSKKKGDFMKRFSSIALVVMLICFLAVPVFAGNGNGIPSGQHFLLNVIGYDNCPDGDFTDSNRHMIAVKASYAYDPSGLNKSVTVKTNTIGLVPGSDFAVTDGNACNKGGAQFILPSDVATTYEVYVKLVGKPGTGIDVTTCAYVTLPL